jgi:hypothetical protein
VAAWTLPNLANPMRAALWSERAWLGCAPGKIQPAALTRLDLYAAVAERDASRMRALAQALLPEVRKQGATPWAQFVLLSAVVGAKASGDAKSGNALWQEHGSAIFGPNLPLHAQFVASY